MFLFSWDVQRAFALNSLVSQTLVLTEDSEASLRAILKYSLFHTVSELEEQLDSIQGKKGTKIIIWNIRRSVAHTNQMIRIYCIYKAPYCTSTFLGTYTDIITFTSDFNVVCRWMYWTCWKSFRLIWICFEYRPEMFSLTNVLTNKQLLEPLQRTYFEKVLKVHEQAKM